MWTKSAMGLRALLIFPRAWMIVYKSYGIRITFWYIQKEFDSLEYKNVVDLFEM